MLGSRRVRFTPQMEIAECGAASLAMVLEYFGHCASLAEVREACGVSRDGLTARSIVEAARRYGLEAKGLRLEIDDLADKRMPLILHWNLNHFLVLERMTRRGAVIVDPASGRRSVSRAELERSFTGVALQMTPGQGFERRVSAGSNWQRYARAVARSPRALFMVLFGTLILEILGLASPASMQLLVDHVIEPGRGEWLLPLAAVVGGVGLLRLIFQFVRAKVLVSLNAALDVGLMVDFVTHLSRLPITFFDQRSPGDLVARVGCNQQLRATTVKVVSCVLDGGLAFSYAALMVAYNSSLAGIVLFFAVLRVLAVSKIRERSEDLTASILTAHGKEQGALLDALSAPEVVRAYGMEPMLAGQHAGKLAERLNIHMDRARLVSGYPQWLGVLGGLSQALVVWFGGHNVLSGEMTIGAFAGFLTIQHMLAPPLQSLLDGYNQIAEARGTVRRVDDVLDARLDHAGTEAFDWDGEEIVFSDVSFRYGPTSPFVCKNLNFRVQRGEKIAIVGRSGQGKSTVGRLLLGMLAPTEGRVTVSGRDLQKVELAGFLRHVGAVTQMPFLFDDTVEANLRFRVPQASSRDLVDATQIADIHDVIEGLPDGYGTRLGEGGRRLSGGQRQRLVLARALIGRPKLLLLDEATSSLDQDTEARVQSALDRVNCTQIVIAHRLSTIRNADRILVIDGGQVVQYGTFDALSREGGVFRTLVGSMA